MKEAKVNTSWINPNEAWDAAVSSFVERILDDAPTNAFLQDFRSFAAGIAHYGAFNSLAQTLLKLTSPGVPDIYQGNETWDFSLVEPDNRRPVDYTHRRQLLNSLDRQAHDPAADLATWVHGLVKSYTDGCIKLYITACTLRFRRDHHTLFANGAYIPLQAAGPHTNNVVAFMRREGDTEIVVAAPRLLTQVMNSDDLPLDEVWSDDLIGLLEAQPGERYTNLFTQECVQTIEQDGTIGLPVAAIFASVPVALLVKQ